MPIDTSDSDRQGGLLAGKDQDYRKLVDLAPVAIAIVTEDRLVFMNPAGLALLGAQHIDEVIGLPLDRIIAPNDAQTVEHVKQEVRAGMVAATRLDLQIYALDGHVLDVELTALPFAYNGQPAAQLIAVDMTAHKRTQRSLQANEERFRHIAQVTNDALYDLDLVTGTLWCKNGQRRLLDETAPDRTRWENSIHRTKRRSVLDSLAAALANPQQTRWKAEYELLVPSGTYYSYVIDRAYILRDVQGQAIRLIGAITEITEQKHAELAEREQRNLAEALVDISTAINSTLDMDSVLDAILTTTARVVPYDAASITLIDAHNIARVVRSKGFEHIADPSALAALQLPVDQLPDLREIVATQRPVIIDDTQKVDFWIPTPESAWIRSHISMPISTGGDVIGFLHLDSAQPHHFTPLHAQRLTTMAPQIAIALNNAQLYNAVSQHASDLERRVQERTAALHETTERVEAILNNSSDAILLTDIDGSIQQTNRTFDDMLRYDAEALRDKPLTRVAAPESVGSLVAHLEQVKQTGRQTNLEARARRADGSTFSAEIGLAAVKAADSGAISGIVCTLRDITPYKEAEQNLRHALQKERELGELKSRFVIMASHEFRTPLATIQVTSDTLRHYWDYMTETQHEQSFEKIQRQIEHMTTMLEDILIAGKLDAGAIRPEREPVAIAAFLREIVDDFQKSEATHSITFSEVGAPFEAAVDPRLLRQVVTNLLSNAIKYSSEGSPVHVTLTHDNSHFVLSVKDQGIGIPPQDHHLLFDLFHRGANTDAIPGSGLGLAIARQAVDLHGGTITFRTAPETGTTFTVSIPIQPPE